MLRTICIGVILLLAFELEAQTSKDKWVDSVFNQMNIDDKIGQLFMVTLPSDADESDLNDLSSRIKSFKIGGVVFTRINPIQHAALTNQFQSITTIPLLMGVDNPLGLQLDSALTIPPPQALGAIADDSLIYFLGNEMARQMKLLGFHLNFISANSATNEINPILTFGETRFLVSAKSLAYWKGLQSGGILACAKYFPIQGVSVTQVQKGLPAVQLTVDTAQAYPFKILINNRLPALMPASADLPMFYSERKAVLKNIFSSSSLSAAFAGEWIRKNMNYNGLIMVDIKNMSRTSNKFAAGEAETFAFQAGNDIVVTSGNVGPAIRRMKKMLKKQKQFLPQLDASVKKILAFKYDAGLHKRPITPTENLIERLNTIEGKLLQHKIYKAIPAVIANQRNTLPIQSLENKKFTCIVADGNSDASIFTSLLSKYVQTSVIKVNEKSDTLNLRDTLQHQQVIIVALFSNTKEKTLSKLIPILQEPRINKEVIICDFGAASFKPYAQDFPTVITGLMGDSKMLSVIPQILFGGISAQGILPISYGQIPPGTNFKTITLDRLSYSFPEDAGMDSKTLDKIESIAQEAISIGATPGCHVLVAKDGKVIYEKSFGHLTYEKQTPVTAQTIYDLASVTKVTATLQTVMFMHEKGLIDINKKVSTYLPELKTSNKKDFTLKDILTHQAGLWPFLPFWAQTMKDTLHLPQYYSRTLSPEFPLVVADKLYASASMKDSLWNWIIKAKIREKPDRTPFDYRYSDMGFYILQHLAEKLLNQPMHDFLNQNLYEPLGAYTMGYLPLLRFPITQIAPTENDKLFRKALLIGTVHDQGAAMYGGLAGHAGLFSNATDLAKLGQMLLQEGRYGGLQYYRPETVRLFTQKQFQNSRRGLGWDKPTPGDWNGPTALQASPKTFGHTGFTGTCIWVDPEFNVVYIFLSNRVHPDMTNNKLLTANIRSRIQEVIYKAIFEYCKTGGDHPELPVNTPPVEAFGKSQ